MKKVIKINFRNCGGDLNPENNFFTNLLRRTYDVIIDDNPDLIFYSVYPESPKDQKDLSKKGDSIRKISPELYIMTRKIYSGVKNILHKEKEVQHPTEDAIKIFYSSEKIKPDMSKCDFAFSDCPEEEINHPNHTRLLPHLLTDFLFKDEKELPFKREVDFQKIKNEKTKFCNFLYFQDVSLRNKFFSRLSKYKKIDSPGRCMNNMPSIGNYKSAKGSRGSINWAQEKLDFIKDYKFTIAFENEIAEGYTTEKLVHPLLVNSIPIYFGNKKVGRDFNEKCFINYHDFKSMKDLINHIIEVDTNDELYKEYIEQPIFKDKKQHYFNSRERIIKKLNEIVLLTTNKVKKEIDKISGGLK